MVNRPVPQQPALPDRGAAQPARERPRRHAAASASGAAASKRMPEFIAPQLCRLVERPPSGKDWVHEVKFDGYRMQLRIENGGATLKTRKGLDWTEKFPAIADAATRLPDAIIDGEVVALDHNGVPDFAALQAALADHNTDNLIYFAFDLLFVTGEDLRNLPLADRKGRLASISQHL